MPGRARSSKSGVICASELKFEENGIKRKPTSLGIEITDCFNQVDSDMERESKNVFRK